VQQRHILVVDDDFGIRLLLRKLLEGAGYRVTTAEEGQSALHAAWESPPDLVVTDMYMPVNDGYKTINMFSHDQSVQAPVIVVSGSVDHSGVQLVLDAGARAFFSKPIDAPAFLAKVAELLSEARP
jgi:CheY-like chemotaxis protein